MNNEHLPISINNNSHNRLSLLCIAVFRFPIFSCEWRIKNRTVFNRRKEVQATVETWPIYSSEAEAQWKTESSTGISLNHLVWCSRRRKSEHSLPTMKNHYQQQYANCYHFLFISFHFYFIRRQFMHSCSIPSFSIKELNWCFQVALLFPHFHHRLALHPIVNRCIHCLWFSEQWATNL